MQVLLSASVWVLELALQNYIYFPHRMLSLQRLSFLTCDVLAVAEFSLWYNSFIIS